VVLGAVSLFSMLDDIFSIVYGVVMSCVRSRGKNKTTRFGDWAIVTGASDGIGEAIAKDLAGRGHKLVLIARNKAKLEAVKASLVESGTSPADVKIIIADFSVETTAKLYDHIAAELKPIADDIGVLVNNVGVSYPGALRFEEFCTERLGGSTFATEAMVNVNVTSCVKMTGLVLAGMKKRRRGAVLFVSSAHGRLPIGAPLYAEYGGCKAFIENFAKSLAVECEGSGVGVQVHFPYFVATKMAKIRTGSIHAPAPKDFARAVVSEIGNGEVKVVPWWFHKIEDYVLLRLPEFIVAPFVTNMHNGLRKAYIKKVEGKEKKGKAE
jgi:17beta-estradiol 17-dehydrogenase / very-long-chain 3-oxoacyl-CoA reductase